ncbi:MAG: hypothetical protein HYX54_06995 [Chloroflexi bacterium]|nr:hypothetical protein [Chloroflexota bacterium]
MPDSDAARGYLDAAARLNAATQEWGASAESFSAEAAASTSPPAQQLRSFLVKFLPLSRDLALAVRVYQQDVQALPLTTDQRGIADQLVAKAEIVVEYLERWTDPDAFAADMGTSDMGALDQWGGPWLDATSSVFAEANKLRAALGLPQVDGGL